MTLEEFNELPEGVVKDELERCCGSNRWCSAITARRPYASIEALQEMSDKVWAGLSKQDWQEAFKHHPRIGDVESLRAKFSSTAVWAKDEQKGALGASNAAIEGLAKGNIDYEKRYGHIFLICATGKSADEMLAALLARMGNDGETELKIAAAEQAKITRLRLEKLLAS